MFKTFFLRNLLNISKSISLNFFPWNHLESSNVMYPPVDFIKMKGRNKLFYFFFFFIYTFDH